MKGKGKIQSVFIHSALFDMNIFLLVISIFDKIKKSQPGNFLVFFFGGLAANAENPVDNYSLPLPCN